MEKITSFQKLKRWHRKKLKLLALFVMLFTGQLALAQGSTCGNPIIIDEFPYTDSGDTADTGDAYDASDLPSISNAQYADGTGSTSYVSGNDAVYSITPSEDGVFNIGTSLDSSGWHGLWLLEGCDPFESVVAYHTAISGDERMLPEINLVGGTTYYIIISTWPSPQTTEYTLEVTQILCSVPSNLSADDMTTTSATLNWIGTGTNYDVEVVTSGTAPTGTPTYTGVNAPFTTTTPLSASTAYEFYVRQNCGVTDGVSDWTGPFSFMTTQVPATLPYTEDFEGTINWSLVNGTQTNKWVVGSATSNGGSQALYVSNDEGTSNVYSHTTSRVFAYRDIAIPATAEMVDFSFDWKAGGESSYDFIRVWVVPTSYVPVAGTELTAANSGGVQIDGYFNLDTEFTTDNYQIPVAAYQGQIVRLVFEWRNDSGGGNTNPAGAIDNVNIEIVACVTPLNLTAEDITTTAATLNWEATGSLFDIEIVEAGIAPTGVPSYTGVNKPFTTTNPLSHSTTYEYYVRQDCGVDGVSAWAGPYSFRTTQIPATLDYEQDFEGTHSWTLINGTQTNQWVVGDAVGNTGSSLYISNDDGVTNAYTTSSAASTVQAYRDIQIPEDAEMISFSFDWKSGGESTHDYFRVWVVSTDYNPIPGTQISTANSGGIQIGDLFNLQSDWTNERFEIPVEDYAGQMVRLVFEWRNDGSVGTQPAAAIDNINLSVITCFTPSDIEISAIDKNNATVTWETPELGNTPEDGYEIEIRTEGTPGETEGLIDTVNTTDLSATLSGLEPSTSYTIYIKSLCSDDDESIWSTGLTFTTLCDYPDFELVNSEEDLILCGPNTIELEVVSDGIVNWYDAADATEPIFTGTTFETDELTETTSFWMESIGIAEGNLQVGEGTSTSGNAGSPFYHLYGGYKYQYIYTAEELSNAGLFEGPISALAFDVTQAATVNYNDFTIAIGTTEQSTATTTHISDLTQVYSNTAQATPVGINYYQFDNAFDWDGESNIVIQLNWSNNNSGSYLSSAAVRTHTTSSSQTTYTYADNRTAAQILATMTGSVEGSGNTSTIERRPNTYFIGTSACISPREEVVVTISESDPVVLSEESLEVCEGETTDVITITEGLDNYDTYEWSPLAGVSGDETTGWTFTAEATTTFTLTASQSEGACTQTVTVEVVVNPLPVAADLEEEYVVCPETVQAISTGLLTSGANGYDVVWAPFDNLYLDAGATTAYNGESAGIVYFFSADAGDTTYEVTATSSKGCEATFETSVSVSEVITPDIEDVYLCVPTSVEEAVESALNLVWFDSLDSETPIGEFAETGTYYVMNELGSCQSEKVSVEVTVVGVTTPTTEQTTQQFCDSATIEDIVVNHTTGTSLNVYEAATGGTALSAGTTLFTGTFYIAEQIGDCESDRLAVQVTITQTPPAIAPATITICGFEVMANVEIGQQPNAELIWYVNETTPQPMNANTQVYSGTYYASQRIGVCESPRTAITFVVNDALPQPTASSQSFCTSPVVSDLVVTGAEGAIFRWFDSATSTDVLADNEPLSNGTYYVSQELNGCESNRKAISVQIINTAAPQIANMSICQGTTIAEVEIPATTGVTYKWYVSPTAITALPATTMLTNGTYFISSSYNGCESERVVVDIETTPVPNAPTGEAQQSFVYNVSINEVTIADLVVNEADVLWFAHEDDAATLTNPLESDMPLSDGTTYYAVIVSDNGCVSDVFAVTVTVTLGNNKFDRAKLAYYPNPTQGILNIQYAETIERVEIYNTIGQLVGTQDFSSNQITVDMGNLSNGTYLLKLHIDGYQQLIKVVKN